jgi:hypothetical protein
MRTILLGKPITSDEALAAGLVCDVFEDNKVLDGAIEAALAMAQRPPMALQMAKEAILRGTLAYAMFFCSLILTHAPFLGRIILLSNTRYPDPDTCPLNTLHGLRRMRG